MTAKTSEKNVRLTISVRPEVHEVFKRMAESGHMSLSKAMGEWLWDTIDAAEFMASKMEQARAAPRIVAQELHAYAFGLVDETGALLEKLREKKPVSPPVCNTGGKFPQRKSQKGGKTS